MVIVTFGIICGGRHKQRIKFIDTCISGSDNLLFNTSCGARFVGSYRCWLG